VDFATMMNLEQHGPDTFVGVGPSYPWGGLYGGQIVAQALRAAGLTVDPAFAVQSLHAYFIRSGDASEPIRFEIDRLRNGRTFVTRRVVARQATGAILNLDASFQLPEGGPAVQAATMDETPAPEELPPTSWSPVFDRRIVAPGEAGRSRAWLRVLPADGLEGRFAEDPKLHACGFAYLSDDIPTDAVVALHPDRAPSGSFDHPFFSASLDHSIWFHQPVQADEWLLHDFRCDGLLNARGLAIGHIFRTDGEHVATVAQEVLLRPRRG
jgi:acyl-CoA thioesterase-2